MTLTQNISIWDTVDFLTKEEKSYVEFPYDPLAGICAHIRLNKPTYDFLNDKINDVFIENDDIDLAKKIRRHYKYKLLKVKLLNSRPLSDYEKKLDRFLESDRCVEFQSVGILCTLYGFYLEDRLTEQIFAKCRSLGDKYVDRETLTIENRFEFVDRIQRNCQKIKSTRYYFKNKHNELLLKEINNNESGKNLMDYILNLEPIVTIKGHARVGRQAGHDFRLLILENFELVKS